MVYTRLTLRDEGELSTTEQQFRQRVVDFCAPITPSGEIEDDFSNIVIALLLDRRLTTQLSNGELELAQYTANQLKEDLIIARMIKVLKMISMLKYP